MWLLPADGDWRTFREPVARFEREPAVMRLLLDW